MAADRPPLDDALFDLVRLLPDDERLPVLDAARVRRRALALAERMGVRPSPEAVRAAAASFRRARGLTRADDLSAWCSDRGVTPEAFARLMAEEAALAALGGGADVDARDVADLLRVADASESAWTRARLALHRGASALTERELLHEWYEARLGRPAPDDEERVEADARAHGFAGRGDLLRALRRAVHRDVGLGATPSVGDALPDFVLRHEALGDVRPDLYAGRWWALVVAGDGDGGGARARVEALSEWEGLAVGVGVDVPGSWVAADDPEGAVRGRLGAGALLVSPAGRVAAVARDEAPEVVAAAFRGARGAYEPPRGELTGVTAPVLVVPGAFEASFCRRLVDAWGAGERSQGAVTADGDEGAGARVDAGLKRRVDLALRDEALDGAVRARLARRVFPEVRRAFQFEVTACEGFRVGCYEASDRGFFRAHRDDANPATARRRFALSVNLARGDYEGGALRLPEYGAAFDAPTGAAVVYSASVLHEVEPVTAGRRFVLVGFFAGAGR